MSYTFPQGDYYTKEELLEEYKKINRIGWMEEDVFLDCLEMRDDITYPHLDNLPKKFWWRTDRVQPKMRKRSRIRDALTVFMTYFVKITDWFMR